MAEFYPTSIKYVAFGISALVASVSAVLVQIIMTSIGEEGIDPFLILGCVSGIISVLYFGVPETLNCKIKDEVKEVEEDRKL